MPTKKGGRKKREEGRREGGHKHTSLRIVELGGVDVLVARKEKRNGGRDGGREGTYLVAVVEFGEVDVLAHVVALGPQVGHHLFVFICCFDGKI